MPRQDVGQWNFGPPVLGWVLPGLGHWWIGERQRGAILAVSIGGVWLAGLLIGGIGVISYEKHPAWFVGQALTLPSVLVHFRSRSIDSIDPDPDAAFRPSFGRVREQGILYTALAGLLNLLTMIDLVYRRPPDASGATAARGATVTET